MTFRNEPKLISRIITVEGKFLDFHTVTLFVSHRFFLSKIRLSDAWFLNLTTRCKSLAFRLSSDLGSLGLTARSWLLSASLFYSPSVANFFVQFLSNSVEVTRYFGVVLSSNSCTFRLLRDSNLTS